MGVPYPVSIHAPAWGATKSAMLGKRVMTVSIHAPAWGATDVEFYIPRANLVSIHAPAWGATGSLACSRSPPPCFNPRARVGRDQRVQAYWKNYLVSIHAPAWGATFPAGFFRKRERFQSTRPRGARHLQNFRSASVLMFQSTRPRGARPPARANRR